MTSNKKGVAAILKKDAPNRLLTHCYCHALNVPVGDTVKTVPVMREKLDAYELTKLIEYFPKRKSALERKQEELQRIANLRLMLN